MTKLLAFVLVVGCSDYGLNTGFKATEATPESFDTGCSVDLPSWDLDPRWERSTMSDRVQTETIGTCISDALAIPTSSDQVWDSGTNTPEELLEEGVTSGRSWASWDQLSEVDCHHFTLTVDLPSCDWSELELTSPWLDGIAINDNLYIIVQGETFWAGGTSYDLVNGSGPAETGGWMAEQFPALPADLLGDGEVTIDLILEEREEWGGLGFLEPVLIP